MGRKTVVNRLALILAAGLFLVPIYQLCSVPLRRLAYTLEISIRRQPLDSRDVARFADWLTGSLRAAGIADTVIVDGLARKPALGVILVPRAGISLMPRLTFNAAYDGGLDVVLVDAEMVRQVLAVGLRDLTRNTLPLDPDLGLSGKDLLLFMLLHECGHRADPDHGHRLFDAFPGATSELGGEQNAELWADSYALRAFRWAAAGAGEMSWDDVWERVSLMIGMELLDTVPARGRSPITLATQSHPTLLHRVRRLLEVMAGQASAAPHTRLQARTYARLLSETRGKTVFEIAPPDSVPFLAATHDSNDLFLLLADGRICRVRGGDLRRQWWQPRTGPLYLRATSISDQGFGEHVARRFQGFWSWGDSIYALDSNAGELWRASESTRWEWRLALRDATLGACGAQITWRSSQRVVASYGSLGLRSRLCAFRRSSGSLSVSGAGGEAPSLLVGEKSVWRRLTWGGTRGGFGYEYGSVEGTVGTIRGILYRWQAEPELGRESVAAFDKSQGPVPGAVVCCDRDNGFVGIALSASGDSVTVLHYDAQLRLSESWQVPTALGFGGMGSSGAVDAALTPGPPEVMFTLKSSHSVVFQLAGNGVYAVDLDTRRLSCWQWFADASSIGLEIPRAGVIISSLGDGLRVAGWKDDM